jgi:hypothetical protein
MLSLDPESVLARVKQAGAPVRLPTLRQSVLVGTLGFTSVSVLMYGLWAVAGGWLQQTLGELLFYAVLAVGFMAGGGAVFKPILIGANLGRFYVLFVGSFLLYAVIWTVCWFQLRTAGEWLATVLGPAVMAALFAWAFGAGNQALRCAAVLILGHTIGYFIGSWLFAWEPLRNRLGMVLWGVTYGAGFGAGISYALHQCQTAIREEVLKLVARPEPGEADAE